LDAERNTSLVYRSIFPEEYVVMDDYLFQLLNTTACQNPQPIESDITFVVSLDTNGVVEMYINGNQTDNAFHTALLQDVNLRMSQPYRYGFSMPVKEELRYHISSNRTSVWVQKTNKGYVVKDQALEKLYAKEFRSELASAPAGKYFFEIHQNVIDNHALSTVRLTKAKGGKAKKWLKAR
jgi:Lhr-like helicase